MAFNAKKARELASLGGVADTAAKDGIVSGFDPQKARRLATKGSVATEQTDFYSRYNAWAEQANALVKNANERFFDETGTFQSAYRSDAKDWYSANESAFREVESQRQALLGGLNGITGLSDEQRQNLRKALSNNLSDLASLAKFEAQFDSEHDYQAHVLNTTTGNEMDAINKRRSTAAAIEARIAELDKLIAAEPTPDMDFQGGPNPGDLFTALGHMIAGTDKTESQKAYEAERDKLVTALNAYDRSGAKRSDQMYAEIATIPQYEQKSAYKGTTLEQYQQRLDEITAVYDDYANGKLSQDELIAWGVAHGVADADTIKSVMLNPAMAKAAYVDLTQETVGNAVAIYDQSQRQDLSAGGDALIHISPYYASIVGAGRDGNWEYLTEDETKYHTYLLNEGRSDDAAAFMQNMQPVLARRKEEDEQQKTYDAIVNSHPAMGFVGGALTSAMTVPLVTGGGVVSLIGTAADALAGKDYDPYAKHNAMLNSGLSQREAVSQAITDSTDWEIGGRNVAAFLYNTGMSMADSATGMALMGPFSSLAMGTRSSMQEAKRLYNQGATDSQIFWGATAAGVAETLFETVSVGRLFDQLLAGETKTFGKLLLDVLSQAGTEASEELLTEVSNSITNTLIMRGQSDFMQSVSNYRAAVYSEEEAQKKAITDVLGNVLEATVGGFISGGVMGGGASGINYANYRAAAKEAGYDTAAAGQVGETYKLAQALAEKEGNKTLDKLVKKAAANQTVRSIGRVRLEVEEALSAGRITAQEAMQILATTEQQNTAAETGSGEVKYQIRHTTDNRPVVEVTDNILEGVDKKDWQKTVKKAIKENFSEGVPISGRLIKVTGKTAGEYAYSQYTRRQASESKQIYEDKMTAAGKLDEIVLASTNYINEDLNHERADDITEFARGDVLMRVGGRDYSAKVVVGYTTSGEMLLYDVVDFEPTSLTMKKDGASQNRPSVETGYDRGDAPSTTSISDPVGVVKSLGRKFGVDAQTAELMVEEYDGKSDPAAYAQAFATAYTFARYNLPMDDSSAQVVRQTLSDISMRHATQLGRLAAKTAAAEAQTKVEARRAKLAKGGADTADINTANLTARQRQSIGALDALGKALGVRFVMYDSQTSGKATENGFYTTGTNEIYVDVRAGLDARGTILYTASHELTHFIEDWSPAKYREFADFLMKELGKTDADVTAWVAQQKALLRRAGTKLTGQELDDAAFAEVVAQACESFLAQPTVLESIERLAKQNQSLYSKIRSWLKRFYNKLRKARLHYDQSMLESAEGRAVAEMTDTVAELVELWSAGLVDAAANAQAASVRATAADTVTVTEGTRKSQIKADFYEQYDAWDGENPSITFTLGNTSDALQSIGIKNQQFQMRTGMILQKMHKHEGITREVFRQIPELLEHPVIVQFSDAINPDTGKPKYTSRITVLGELYAEMTVDGKKQKKPVLVSIELLPTNRAKTKVLDISIITSAYGHTKLQQYLNENSILYVEPNKKRTDAWLSLNRLQLPVGENQYGSIRSIAYTDGKVKIQNAKHMTAMQRALQDAGVVDSYGISMLNADEGDTVGVRKSQIKAEFYEQYDTAGRRLSAEQQEFFKDSKVRDENGNLIALYHGTENGGFTVFDAAKSDDGASFFFTDNIRIASTYSGTTGKLTLPKAKPPKLRWTEGNTARGKHQEGVYEVYVNLKNPLVVDCENSSWMQIPFRDSETVDVSYSVEGGEVIVQIAAKSQPTQTVRFTNDGTLKTEVQKFLTDKFNGRIGKEYAEMLANDIADDPSPSHLMGFGWNFVKNTEETYSTRDIAAVAKKEGYDGVIFHDVYDSGNSSIEGIDMTGAENAGNIYVAFSSNAVKDVDNKTPTANKDIRYQARAASVRRILAEALESTAVNEQEQKLIRDYLEQVDELDAAEQELAQVNRQIRDMMFSKGERDAAFYEKLGELHKRAGRLKNRIEWGDKQLLSLRSTTPIDNLLDRERAAAAKRAKDAARKEYRERRENAQKTELRDKLSRRVRHISSMLLRGNKQRNVKPELQELTVKALESAAALFEESGENIGECLVALERAYQDLGELDPNAKDIPKAERARVQQSKKLYKPEVAERLADVRKEVGTKPVSEMDIATLEKVNDAFTALHHTLTESNKVFKNGKAEDVETAAGRALRELKSLKLSRKDIQNIALRWLEKYSWANENPVFAFDRIGSKELSEMFWDLIAGQDTWARDMQDARDLITHLRKKYGFNEWEQTKRTDFKLESGQTFSLNLQEIMSVYAYSKREQALPHMTDGGFVFSDEAFSQGKFTGKWLHHNTAVTYRLTEADISKITAALTKEQKGYADELQAYLSTTMGAKGNEVSRVLYGIDLFKERHYFPLQSSRQFLASTQAADSKQPSMVSLKNTGMTKEIVPGAGNPIVLRGFDVVCNEHIDKMSQYHGLVLPIENLQKVFNYTSYAADGGMISVRNQLTATHGDGAVTYLQQLLSDLNGGISQPGVKSPTLKMFAKFKKTAVGASLSTVVQQPTAIVRAMALIDPKYFAQKAEKQIAPLKTSGDKIAAGMTDAERYEVLKRKTISIRPYHDERYQQILRDHPEVDVSMMSKSDMTRIFKKIASEFDVYGMYTNSDIELQFEYGSRRIGESISKSRGDYEKFAKLLSCFSEVVENAVGIEVHNRNEEGYKPDRTLKNVYVLASAFEDGDQIVPVKLEVKEFTDKPNRLYMVVALESIKKDRVVSTGVLQSESHVRTSPVTISILDLLQNVNSKDVSLLKYVPGYKTGDTADRINGLERPKPNEGYAQRNGISTNSISDSDGNVKTYEEIKRYAPIATVKEIGGFDTGSTAGAVTWLDSREYDGIGQKAKAVVTDENYRDELWMKGAQKADELGWSVIWNAVKAEVADKQGLSVGSEAFYQACGKRFTEVIVRSQVYDSVLSRSGFMRSSSEFNKMATSFMGEPTMSFNMMASTIRQAIRTRSTADIQTAARTVATVYAAQMLAKLFATFVYALRKREEDEPLLERWMQEFAGGWPDLLPFAMLPYVRDVQSLLMGYTLERSDMSVLGDLIDGLKTIFSTDYTDPADAWKAAEEGVGLICNAFGLPIRNLLRDFRSMCNLVMAATDTVVPTDMGGALLSGLSFKEKAKSDRLYAAFQLGDEQQIETLREGYASETAFQSAVVSALRQNDERIKQAAAAAVQGDFDALSHTADAIYLERAFEEDIIDRALQAEYAALSKSLGKAATYKAAGDTSSYADVVEEIRDDYAGILTQDDIRHLVAATAPSETAETDESSVSGGSVYTMTMVNAALESGDSGQAVNMIDELYQLKQEKYRNDGKSRREAEKSARSDMRSSLNNYWKQRYIAAYNSKDRAEQMRIKELLSATGMYTSAGGYKGLAALLQEWRKEAMSNR